VIGGAAPPTSTFPPGTRRVITVDRSLNLDLEVVEIERKGRPGCGNSSSTNPRCTCLPAIDAQDI
jgi:hypothetical protein